MTDENRKSNPVPTLLGYKSLTENFGLNDRVREVYVNESFEDSETNSTPLSNGYAGNSIEVSNSRSKNADEDDSKDKIPPVSFFVLFRYSSNVDKVLIFIGCIAAFFSGSIYPTAVIIFANILDLFIDLQNTQNNLTAFNSSDSSVFSTEDFLADFASVCLYAEIVNCLGFCFDFMMISFFSMAAANQTFKIRCLLMRSVLSQDIAWFDTNGAGDIASRLTGDLSRIQDGIGDKVGICIKYMSCAIISVCYALYFGWKLTLFCICVMPILTVAMGLTSKIEASITSDELHIYGAAGSVAEEVFSSIRTVVSFGGERKEIDRYNKCLIPARKKGIRRGLFTSIGSAAVWFCTYAGYALAYWYGAKLVVEGKDQGKPEYKPSTLFLVLLCVKQGATEIGFTALFFEAFALARGAAGKIFSIIERKPQIDYNSETGKVLPNLKGSITLKDVHFNYPARPDVPVLRGVSFNVKSGETIALVGSSGCGKSTIVQLIQRFYDVDRGSVEIDGTSVRDFNLGWLRNHIGAVGQEPVLFSTTVAENIRYGKVGATQDEIETAAKLANVHNFIESLPLKYNTLVGEKGIQLSGGQKQRVAIARALIKNPKILLLDEATSALDTESEAIVQSALDLARQGRTTIIVAHRLSTIRAADKIAVLSNGVVKEIETHDKLMQKNGIYYQLVMAETKAATKDEDNILDEDLPVLERQMSKISAKSDNSDKALSPNMQRTFSARKNEEVVTPDGNEEKIAAPSQARFFKICEPELPYIITGSIASTIMGLFTSMYGIVFGDIIQILTQDSENIVSDIAIYSFILLAMAVSAGIASFLQTFMFSIAGETLTSRLRKMVFTTIICQDISWFDDPQNSVGSLCSRLSSDASSVQTATGSRISTIMQALSTLVASIAVGLWFNYKIGIVLLSFISLFLLTTFLEGRVISRRMLNEKSSNEHASKLAVEAIKNIKTVKSLCQEETFYNQFRTAYFEPYKESRKNLQIRGLTYAFDNSILYFAYFTSGYYGGILVTTNELSFPDLFKVLTAVIYGASMISKAVAFTPDFQKAKLAATHIFKLLDLKPKFDAFSKHGRKLDDVKGHIRFKNVDFNYPSRPRVKILRGMNLEVEPGQTVAVVGSSGCGKSTCIQLIERFYDTISGDVMLDDASVKDMNVGNLRSHIGLVSQEPVLFSYSFAENIAYGDNSRKVEMDEIIAAARKANIHNFIASLPQGYDTPVGDKGTQLSGGQKQRIAIARALLRNPKILLLDEATSALDAENEKVVQEALNKARSGRTCLIIAHRLSTIQNADLILVIHRGRVVEKGTHQELLNLKGRYFNFHNAQASMQ